MSIISWGLLLLRAVHPSATVKYYAVGLPRGVREGILLETSMGGPVIFVWVGGVRRDHPLFTWGRGHEIIIGRLLGTVHYKISNLWFLLSKLSMGPLFMYLVYLGTIHNLPGLVKEICRTPKYLLGFLK